MKKERRRKRSKIPAKKSRSESDSAASGTPAAVIDFGATTETSMPPPELLYRQAEEEPDIQSLSSYVGSIQLLREKGFSYREISEWLSERGVHADHNAVYRVYINSLPQHELYLEDQREAEEAREEAERNSL